MSGFPFLFAPLRGGSGDLGRYDFRMLLCEADAFPTNGWSVLDSDGRISSVAALDFWGDLVTMEFS